MGIFFGYLLPFVLSMNYISFNLSCLLLSGQVVSAEILMASEHGCPIEMHRIPIEKCDEMYDEQCDGQTFMPFHRAHYDTKTGQSPNSPREQVREHTIGGCSLSGTGQGSWCTT
jgi:hypothetical protein